MAAIWGLDATDIVALSALSVAGLALMFRLSRRVSLGMAAATVIALLIGGTAFEMARWQIYPAYFGAVLLVLGVLAGFGEMRLHRWLGRLSGRTGGVLIVLCAALSLLACWLFPVFPLPVPSGPYAVGGDSLWLVDKQRGEPHTGNPTDKRELMVRFWYPAAAGGNGATQPYFAEAGKLGAALNSLSWPFGYVLTHLDVVPTHTVSQAPIARSRERFPVVIFSHGLGGVSVQNTALFEELASHGYVVASIDHPYGALATVFPDGRSVPHMPSAYASSDPEAPPEEEAKLTPLLNSEDPVVIERLSRHLMKIAPNDAAIGAYWNDVWSADQRFVISMIEKLDAGAIESRFEGRLDTRRIAVTGMSFGAAAAQLTCARDERCAAGINMDGYRAANVGAPPQHAPFLYFNSAPLSVNSQFLHRDGNRSYWVKVKDAEHFDFTDVPLISPLAKMLGASGAVKPARMNEILNAYILQFLDQSLKGKASLLLNDTTPPWDNVRFLENDPALHKDK